MKLITRSNTNSSEIVVLRTKGGHFAPLGKTPQIVSLCDRYYAAIKVLIDDAVEERGKEVPPTELWIVTIKHGRWTKRSISIESVPRKN